MTSKFYCNICSRQMYSAPYFETHLAGRPHQEKLEEHQQMPKVRRTDYDCNLCGEHLPTQEKFHQHLVAHNGRKYERQNGRDESECCDIKDDIRKVADQLADDAIKSGGREFDETATILLKDYIRHVVDHLVEMDVPDGIVTATAMQSAIEFVEKQRKQ